MDILELNPVEYGAAVGHIAAMQLLQILEGSRREELLNWYGGSSSDPDQVGADIIHLAGYLVATEAKGEQLWRYAVIEGRTSIEGNPDRDFTATPIVRQFAFNMFATVSLQAWQQLHALQVEARDRALREELAGNLEPMKLEDSIFETVGSLDELDKHAEQFLSDLATFDATEIPAAPATIPTMSIGQSAPEGESIEKEAADQGQKAGAAAGEDPEQPGEVRELGTAGFEEAPADQGGNGAGEAPGDQVEQRTHDDGGSGDGSEGLKDGHEEPSGNAPQGDAAGSPGASATDPGQPADGSDIAPADKADGAPEKGSGRKSVK